MNDQIRASLINLVQTSPLISYSQLHQAFGTQNDRSLESLIVEAFHEGLIDGQLDPKQKTLEIRDWKASVPEPSELAFIKNVLADWMAQSDALLGSLKDIAQVSNENSKKIKEEEEKHEKLVEQRREELEHMGRFNRFDDHRAVRSMKRATKAGPSKRNHH